MKKHKEKKHKKHKKQKKSKKSKHSASSSSDSDEWEEAGAPKKSIHKEVNSSYSKGESPTSINISHGEVKDSISVKTFQKESVSSRSDEQKTNREDWMMSSSLLDAVCSSASARENKTKQRKVEERREVEQKNQEIQATRELNPYWKNGQTGLPSEDTKLQLSTESSKGVCDSGRSWIQKAYERAKEQAKEENIPLEEIVAKRWGSMQKLEALLKASRRASRPSHSSSRRSSSSWKKHNISESRDGKSQQSKSRASESRDESSFDKQSKSRASESRDEKSSDQQLEYGKSNNKVADIISTDVKYHKSKMLPSTCDGTVTKECSPSSGTPDNNSIENKEVKNISEEEKNQIHAKILRAEIMGDDDLVSELKGKLLTGNSKVKSDRQNKTVARKPITEEERNQLSAKLLRAELMGEDDLVAELKAKLQSTTADTNFENSTQRKRKDSDSSCDSGHEEVILTRADKHGNLYPVKLSADDHQKPKRKKIMSTHDKLGQRVRYFEDDDSTELKTMVEQERLTSADDQQAMLARLAGKHLGKTMGDDYTLDDMFVQASATKGETKAEDKRTKEKAIAEHKQHKLQLSSCRFCFENSSIAKHLIITIGSKVYLTLTLNASLTDGHCLIVPANHTSTQTYMDEDVLQEIKKFKNNLTQMFSESDEDVIFLETCKNLRSRPHCVIECVPVAREIGDMAPLYFKKAIMESESEWSQNKKLITVTAKGGIAKAVPKGLPYFAVEFGLDGGFAHIIEEESFPHYFGKEVIGGMLDLEPRLWLKPPKESFEQHKRKILKFTNTWKKYDLT